MKSDEVTVTLYACHTAEGFAKACRDHAEGGLWPAPCPVGWLFACPFSILGNGRCGKIEAEDWESVMNVVEEDVADDSAGACDAG